MTDKRVYGESVKLTEGEEHMGVVEDEHGNLVWRGLGIHDPGRIEMTLLTATRDPGEVSGEEILEAVRDLLGVETEPDE